MVGFFQKEVGGIIDYLVPEPPVQTLGLRSVCLCLEKNEADCISVFFVFFKSIQLFVIEKKHKNKQREVFPVPPPKNPAVAFT